MADTRSGGMGEGHQVGDQLNLITDLISVLSSQSTVYSLQEIVKAATGRLLLSNRAPLTVYCKLFP